ncbi:MFS transporter [Sanguibacter suarezii]|uniref:MFS transporter n=1 Tax=Sanguibacter suarezii TaxID=60921 RepID=UPI000A04337E|nr:MFS transporter [Sanguibacter suarezii]
MKKWSVLIVLGCAQFVLVLDGTVMNVSISTVVADLDTTVTAMQAAITFYTLTMAALMLLGAKLGDVWGRRRAFVVGSMIYATGSLITALSPNFAFLFLGWSIVEGLGAVLVIPAVAALVADNYTGTDRVKAYATIGALSGAAVAAGPLIGGFLTTYASWRYVFAGEVVIMIIVVSFSRLVTDSTPREPVRIDIWSVLLSSSGLVLAVFGMLQSKTWGWVRPAASPDIAGREITPLGISLTSWLILAGTFLLYAFVRRQGTLVRSGRPPLVHMEVFSIRVLRSGLTVLGAQYAITAGLFFMVPVYLQMTLGLDALATGTKIFPLSVSLILFSVVGTRLSARWSPRRIVRWGQSILVVSSLVLLGSVSIDLKNGFFAAGMFCAGAGLGLLASQLGNVNMSAVTEKQTSEVGGLQGVFQNLGSSLGTAVIGSVLIASLTTSFTSAVAASDLPASAQSLVSASTQDGVPIVEASSVDTIAAQAGLTTAQGQTLTTLYTDSQVTSLRLALFALTVIGLLSLLFSRRIPADAPPPRAPARRSPPTDEAPQVRAQKG